jgi:hypothetical protein
VFRGGSGPAGRDDGKSALSAKAVAGQAKPEALAEDGGVFRGGSGRTMRDLSPVPPKNLAKT